jgi:hypothetical protein
MRAERTAGPQPEHVAVDDARAEVTIRGRLTSGTGVVFALLGAAVVAGLLFVTVSPRAEANPHNAVAVLTAAGVLLGLTAFALATRHQRLVIGADRIVHERCIAGLCWSRRRIDRGSVDAVNVQARGAGGHGVAIIGRQGRLLVGASLKESELEWLRAWVQARLLAKHTEKTSSGFKQRI